MFRAKVEGTILEVCEQCLRYGERIIEPQSVRIQKKKTNIRPPVEEETILVENYGKMIVEARKRKNLNREEFAKKINEKESVIRRVENGEMKPNDKLTEKIERFLEIKLKKVYEEKRIKGKVVKGKLTLGDVVEVE